VLTDQAPMLPTLRANVALNLTTAEQARCTVRELCWGDNTHIAAALSGANLTPSQCAGADTGSIDTAAGTFDFVVGADIVYMDSAVESLVTTIGALATADTTGRDQGWNEEEDGTAQPVVACARTFTVRILQARHRDR